MAELIDLVYGTRASLDLSCALRKFWCLHMSGYFTVELCPKLWTHKFSLEHIDSPVSFFPGFCVQEIIKLFKKAHYNRVV